VDADRARDRWIEHRELVPQRGGQGGRIAAALTASAPETPESTQ
jgi:hypothetical protein